MRMGIGTRPPRPKRTNPDRMADRVRRQFRIGALVTMRHPTDDPLDARLGMVYGYKEGAGGYRSCLLIRWEGRPSTELDSWHHVYIARADVGLDYDTREKLTAQKWPPGTGA